MTCRSATSRRSNPATPATSPASARWTPRLVRGLYNVWCGACLTALVVLIGLRWLRYSSWSTTPVLNDLLREAMVIEAQTFLWAWVFGTVKGATVLRALVIVVGGPTAGVGVAGAGA